MERKDTLRGRKIQCVRAKPSHEGILTEGKVYTILDANSACFKIRNDQNRRRYYDKDCFILVSVGECDD